MHRNIKKFTMNGMIGDDADFPNLREQFERMMVKEMRGHGYVPVIGLGPFFSTLYDIEKNHYDFVISVYGVYLGRRKSWEIDGIMVDGREISIPKAKSNPSS